MNDRPVNASQPPWGATDRGQGEQLPHARLHREVQHPNVMHLQREAASPFTESVYGGLGWAGRARHHAPFSAPGLRVGVRK